MAVLRPNIADFVCLLAQIQKSGLKACKCGNNFVTSIWEEPRKPRFSGTFRFLEWHDASKKTNRKKVKYKNEDSSTFKNCN